MISKKVLCVCEGGNVRSVTLAYILKASGVDAIACGVLWNTSTTIKLLTDWADLILLAEGRLIDKIPKKDRQKIIDMEIGPDVWGQAMVPTLLNFCQSRIQEKLQNKL